MPSNTVIIRIGYDVYIVSILQIIRFYNPKNSIEAKAKPGKNSLSRLNIIYFPISILKNSIKAKAKLGKKISYHYLIMFQEH